MSTRTRPSATQAIGNLAIMIGTAPDIWRRGLDGEELTSEDEIAFFGMVEAAESHIFNLYLRFDRLDINDPEILVRDYAYGLRC